MRDNGSPRTAEPAPGTSPAKAKGMDHRYVIHLTDQGFRVSAAGIEARGTNIADAFAELQRALESNDNAPAVTPKPAQRSARNRRAR